MSVFLKLEQAEAILFYLIRVWEQTRDQHLTIANQWTINLSNLVVSYIPFTYWDQNSISKLYFENVTNKSNEQHLKLDGNDVIDILGTSKYNYGCIFCKDIISNDINLHHWTIEFVNVTVISWSFTIGLYDINTIDIEKLNKDKAVAKGYGFSLDSVSVFCLNVHEAEYEGLNIPNFKIKNGSIIDLYLDFNENSLKLVENNKIIFDLIKGSDVRSYVGQLKINSNTKYKLGIFSRVKNNHFRLLKYDNQSIQSD